MSSATVAGQFARLVEIAAQLRAPEGCPWDRQQTLESLSRFVLEEAYEVVDAIERGDVAGLQEEIGDHILEAVFLAQIAAERGWFTVGDSLLDVTGKLIRRHPHVFQEDGRVHDAQSRLRAPSADAALERWNALKARERTSGGTPEAILGGIPVGLPALLRAFKIGKRAAEVGFDWQDSTAVIDKIEEELTELRQRLRERPADQVAVEEEMGDLLLAVANLARKLDIDPESALRKANNKFTERFQAMEQTILASGRSMTDLSPDQLEQEWERTKVELLRLKPSMP